MYKLCTALDMVPLQVRTNNIILSYILNIREVLLSKMHLARLKKSIYNKRYIKYVLFLMKLPASDIKVELDKQKF